MKQSLLAFILVLFIFQSCDKEVHIPSCENCSFTCLEMDESNVIGNECIENWDCNFTVSPQSKIDLYESEGKVDGKKNVFQMINSTEGSLSIADDEFTNILVFELDESQMSFSVEDSELKDLKVHFRRICHCYEVDFKAIKSGCMQGEIQTDGSWFVQGNLVVSYSYGDFEIKFEAQFEN